MNNEIKQHQPLAQKNEEDIDVKEIFRKEMLSKLKKESGKIRYPDGVYFEVDRDDLVKHYLALVNIATDTNNPKLLAYLEGYLEEFPEYPEFAKFVQEPLNKAQQQMKLRKKQQ